MSRYDYEGPSEYRPLSPWAYFGYSILFLIPAVGLVLLIVFSLSDQNINRRNYARSYFCWLVILLILIGASLALYFAGGGYAAIGALVEKYL